MTHVAVHRGSQKLVAACEFRRHVCNANPRGGLPRKTNAPEGRDPFGRIRCFVAARSDEEKLTVLQSTERRSRQIEMPGRRASADKVRLR